MCSRFTLRREVWELLLFLLYHILRFFANLNPAVFRRYISLHNQTLNAFSEPQHFVLEIIRAGSHSVIRQIESQMQTGRPHLQHIHPARLHHTPQPAFSSNQKKGENQKTIFSSTIDLQQQKFLVLPKDFHKLFQHLLSFPLFINS